MLPRTIIARAAPLARTAAIRSARSVIARPATAAFAAQSNLALQRYAAQLSARFSSSAAALAEREPEEDEADVSHYSSGSTSASAGPSSSSSVDDAEIVDEDLQERVPFQSLQGVVASPLVRALTVKPFKFEHMSEVQRRVLTLLPDLAGTGKNGQETKRDDLLVKAKTGTGKTVAFLVPAIEARLRQLERLTAGKKGKRERELAARDNAGTLVISPTRELASQIAKEAEKLCSGFPDMKVHMLVGGENKRQQMRNWMRNTRDIVVGTPGRLKDLMESEPEFAAPLKNADMLILDEADTLLEMGFQRELDSITDQLPSDRQTFLFSATVSRDIRRVAKDKLKPGHMFIDCVPENESNSHAHIPQYAHVLPDASQQIPALLKLISQDMLEHRNSKVIVFLPTTKLTQLFTTIIRELEDSLPSRPRVFEIHSGKDQGQRSRASQQFRQETRPSILVTSDVSARGVDYPGVTRVIQMGPPKTSDLYVHRVGRTGRGSAKTGRSDLILQPFEAGFLRRLANMPVQRMEPSELDAQLTAAGQSTKPRWAEEDLPRISEAVKGVTDVLDPDAIDEVFTSMLGFYVGMTDELEVNAKTVLEGLQGWTTGAAGLPEPPHTSASFLAKLGFSPKRMEARPRGGGGGGGAGSSRGSFGMRNGSAGSGGRGGSFSSGERGRDGGFRSSSGGRRDGGRSFGDRDGGRSFGGDRSGGRSFGGGGKEGAPWQMRGNQTERRRGF